GPRAHRAQSRRPQPRADAGAPPAPARRPPDPQPELRPRGWDFRPDPDHRPERHRPGPWVARLPYPRATEPVRSAGLPPTRAGAALPLEAEARRALPGLQGGGGAEAHRPPPARLEGVHPAAGRPRRPPRPLRTARLGGAG